jgi:hypothetical protein
LPSQSAETISPPWLWRAGPGAGAEAEAGARAGGFSEEAGRGIPTVDDAEAGRFAAGGGAAALRLAGGAEAAGLAGAVDIVVEPAVGTGALRLAAGRGRGAGAEGAETAKRLDR